MIEVSTMATMVNPVRVVRPQWGFSPINSGFFGFELGCDMGYPCAASGVGQVRIMWVVQTMS